jgi:peptide/nickel transport system permease protein
LRSKLNIRLTGGLTLIGLLIFCAIFADFLSTARYDEQHRSYPFAPPAQIHLTDADGNFHWRPFVYAVEMTDIESRGYNEDKTRIFPIRFFVEREPYKILGLFQSRTHLFGVDEPARIFLLGTDALGRDIFTRLLHGARLSLTIVAVAMVISLPLALLVGCLTGFYGGSVDFVGMRLIELFLALPALYLIIALRSALPLSIEPDRIFPIMAAVIGMFGWATFARITRGLVLSLRQREFVTAAYALGASDFQIIRRHILPHLTGFVLVQASLAAPGFMLAEVTLSYLGLGVQEPLPSWGGMLASTQSVTLMTSYWWNLSPVIAIFITSAGFHLIAEGLKTLSDPRAQDMASV